MRLQNGQLLVTDRLEAQADQMLMTNPPDAHDTDKGLDRRRELRRLDTTDTDLATRSSTEYRNIKHDTNSGDRNIGQRKLEALPAKTQMNLALQENALGSTTLSHDAFKQKNQPAFSHGERRQTMGNQLNRKPAMKIRRGTPARHGLAVDIQNRCNFRQARQPYFCSGSSGLNWKPVNIVRVWVCS